MKMMMMMTGQPGQRPAPQFMAAPEAIPGMPPGLEYLAQIDQLLVHQQIEIFECTYFLIVAGADVKPHLINIQRITHSS